MAVLLLAACGCGRWRHYSPGTLPAELHALPIDDPQKLDPTTFTPPQAASDLIEPGDVLRVSVAAGLGADDRSQLFARVGDDGLALLPEIGPVPLAGLSLVQAEQQIAGVCIQRSLYRRPTVSVALERRLTNRVTVVGAVENPGVYELPRRSSYLGAALVSAGGLNDHAGTKIEIRRQASPARLAAGEIPATTADGVRPASAVAPLPAPQVQSVCLNLSELRQTPPGAQYLDDGSVVTVEKRQFAPVQVLGLVAKPGEYEMPTDRDLCLLGAIALAGGVSNKLADEVLVLRQAADGQGQVKIRTKLQSAKNDADENLRLAPGDVVSVEQTPATVFWDLLNRAAFTIGGSLPLVQ